MLISLAGAMSTAAPGKIFADVIRRDRVSIISCTETISEDDIIYLPAHSYIKRLPDYRDLTPTEEWDLLLSGLNRVTPKYKILKKAEDEGERFFLSLGINYYFRGYRKTIMKLRSKIH